MTYLITVNGVLKGSKGRPIRDGVLLYHSLMDARQRVLLLVDEPVAAVEHWMLSVGLRVPDDLIEAPVGLPGDRVSSTRNRQVLSAVARGASPVVLVDPDPSVVACVYDWGIVGMLFVAPEFAAPQYRPDAPRSRRTWSEIEKSVAEHKKVAAGLKLVDGSELGWDDAE